MAKSRAQRKAEKRRRQQAQQQRQPGRPESERADEERAQEDTQRGVSGDVAEVEAILETGARSEDYGEQVTGAPQEGDGAPEADEATDLQAPAPSRADAGRPDRSGAKQSRRERREAEKEKRRKERERALAKQQSDKPEKRRGPVIGFFISCWAELKKVQWPDRDTLVQASAVTLIFVVIMAAYLGGLDAAFNWMIQRIL